MTTSAEEFNLHGEYCASGVVVEEVRGVFVAVSVVADVVKYHGADVKVTLAVVFNNVDINGDDGSPVLDFEVEKMGEAEAVLVICDSQYVNGRGQLQVKPFNFGIQVPWC